MGLEDVKYIILVLSGKGGVGKSSIAVHLSLTLRDLQYKVGLLDVDLCGPSIPHMLNLEGKDVHQCEEGWMPVFLDKSQTLSVMSIGFLLNDRNDAVIWRGPKKNAMIKQFLNDVHWQDRDFLVVDMPPGTSDEHITLIENIKGKTNIGAILVTTPQLVAINDVRREVTMCKKASLPVLGIVENMSGFVCPHCQECTAMFSKGGGEGLSKELNIPFLGSVPLDPEFSACINKRCAMENVESSTLNVFQSLTNEMLLKIQS